MKATVVGQGYVGLPLAITASRFGYTIYGYDNNDEKIALLKSGKSIIFTNYRSKRDFRFRNHTNLRPHPII
jgi:UDP-N-acetyl-D-mannosaminuronate dehydrogenase